MAGVCAGLGFGCWGGMGGLAGWGSPVGLPVGLPVGVGRERGELEEGWSILRWWGISVWRGTWEIQRY